MQQAPYRTPNLRPTVRVHTSHGWQWSQRVNGLSSHRRPMVALRRAHGCCAINSVAAARTSHRNKQILDIHWAVHTICNHMVTYLASRLRSVSSGASRTQLLKQRVEISQVSIFDDDTAAAMFVFDADFEAKRTLELLFNFFYVGIDRNFWLGIFL